MFGTMNRRYASLLMLLLVIGVAVASESYLDYGDGTADENLETRRDFYRALLRQEALNFDKWPEQKSSHLMIRKSQRSPSLRLRFGRSNPIMPGSILARQQELGSQKFHDN